MYLHIRRKCKTVKCNLIIYVDDLILKDINMFKSVKTKLKKAFEMTDLRIINNILGIKIQREDETGKIRLSQ